MKVAVAAEVPTFEQNDDGRSTRKGTYPGKRIFTENAADGLNLIFVRNDFTHTGENAFWTPRHRHTFAQVRFIPQGNANYGPDQDIPAGSLGYFPRQAYYGPQTKENCVNVGTQFGFGGEHQKGEPWESYRFEALKRLQERGSLSVENGVYTVIDPKTGEKIEREPVEVVYEEQYRMHTGGDELVARDAGYDNVILIHPANFPYFQSGEGVELRELGRFYDWPGPNGDCHLFMVRLSKGATYTLSSERAQVAWSLTPGLSVDGTAYSDPELTSLYSARGEQTSLSGDGIEVYVVEYPRLD